MSPTTSARGATSWPSTASRRRMSRRAASCSSASARATPFPFARDPTLELGRTYRFTQGAAGNGFAGDGLSFPESWGRWTDAKNAFLFFSLAAAPPGPVSIAVDAISLSPPADRRQVATVIANGRDCGRLVVALHKPRAEVTCPAGALHAGDNMLRFASRARRVRSILVSAPIGGTLALA